MHEWHEGELAVHKQLNLLDVNRGRERITTAAMPAQHQAFFSNLTYFVCGTCDKDGRPWASILCGKSGFMHAVSPNHLAFSTTVPADDPILNVEATMQIAGLGVDLSNRRRNKVFGRIQPGMLRTSAQQERRMLQAIITTEESLGNCPKYINIRRLAHHERQAVTKDVSLAECQAHIAAADTIFMATRGPNDMDVNHRGGQAGFVRVSIDGEMTLYIPDYSGNQLFSTLGNIESTAVAGVTVPRFDTGDVLYMTGEAVNVFGNEAAKLMPGVQRLTRIKVTHCQFIAQGLNLKLDDEGVSMSPYNPPIFRLASEPGQRLPQADFSNTATLIQMQSISPTINRYTWKLSTPVSWKPGQYAVFDFAKELSYGYEHMNDQQPQLLNDSFIRTWTITSQSDDIQITVRKSGVVSRYLASHKVEHGELTVPFLGISGDFGSGMSGKVLFIAGGIGITPFLTLGKDCNIALLYSGRLEDDALLEPLQDLSYKRCLHRRITKADIDAVPDSADRRIYCCGPPGLVEAVKAWTMKQVWTESFMY